MIAKSMIDVWFRRVFYHLSHQRARTGDNILHLFEIFNALSHQVRNTTEVRLYAREKDSNGNTRNSVIYDMVNVQCKDESWETYRPLHMTASEVNATRVYRKSFLSGGLKSENSLHSFLASFEYESRYLWDIKRCISLKRSCTIVEYLCWLNTKPIVARQLVAYPFVLALHYFHIFTPPFLHIMASYLVSCLPTDVVASIKSISLSDYNTISLLIHNADSKKWVVTFICLSNIMDTRRAKSVMQWIQLY